MAETIRAVIFDMYETLITQYGCPVFFTPEMSRMIGISPADFRKIWVPTEPDRTIGKISFEEVIEDIMRTNDAWDEEVFTNVINSRKQTKIEAFSHLHNSILPMLEELKHRGIKVGLISNCYTEEAEVIHDCILYPFFDAVCLSCEEGIRKPDKAIFDRCLEQLDVLPEECIYCGDGGSDELNASSALGMHAYQAVWYLTEQNHSHAEINENYTQLKDPMDIISLLEE